MRKWGIRHDGLCNTLSTVQKDNYLLEVPYKDDRDMNNSTREFIKENNHFYKEKKMLSLDIKKLTDQISEIKKERVMQNENNSGR